MTHAAETAACVNSASEEPLLVRPGAVRVRRIGTETQPARFQGGSCLSWGERIAYQEEGQIMARVPDRLKRRREYLSRKRRVYTRMLACVVLGCATFAAWCIVITRSSGLLAGIGKFFVMGALVTWVALRFVKISEEADEIAYAPPVQPTTLPAEEVLVRGADQPPATPDTLLRAAKTGDETQAEQLLRSPRLYEGE